MLPEALTRGFTIRMQHRVENTAFMQKAPLILAALLLLTARSHSESAVKPAPLAKADGINI